MNKLDISVLYVDDDKNIIRLASTLLEQKVSHFSVAQNGKEGLQMFRENPFDIIFTDLDMPELDGFELIEEVRRVDKRIKIAVISGTIDQDNFIQLINLGVDKFILKPFHASVFFEILEDFSTSVILPRKLADSESKYKKIIESANDAIILTDSITGEVIDANIQAEKLFKISRKEIINKHNKQLFPEDEYIKKIKVSFNDLVAGKKPKIEETYIITGNNRKIAVEISPSIINMGHKTVVLEIIRDIRKRKRVEKQLIRAKELAVEANLQKSTFLANMSHEIRTPMNGINGMITLLKKTGLTDEQKEFLEIMEASSSTLLEILDDLIDISKVETGNIKIQSYNFNLKELLDSIMKGFRLKVLKKNVELRLDLDESIPHILSGDHLRIKQVLSNLLGNAIKFTEKGYVELSVKVEKRKKTLIYLNFFVTDTGIGIAEDKLDIIFDIFSQIDPSETRKFGGTGLGLAISRKLADLMGGIITVKSQIGRGSTFCFQLPLKISPVMDEVESEKSRTFKMKPLSILIAEDDFISRKFIVSLLETDNHKVDIAKNGKEVVTKYSKKYYDCILMDIQMPEMNGIDATKEIRKLEEESGRHILILAITANTFIKDKERFLSAGMDDFIGKPISDEELFKLLKQHCS